MTDFIQFDWVFDPYSKKIEGLKEAIPSRALEISEVIQKLQESGLKYEGPSKKRMPGNPWHNLGSNQPFVIDEGNMHIWCPYLDHCEPKIEWVLRLRGGQLWAIPVLEVSGYELLRGNSKEEWVQTFFQLLEVAPFKVTEEKVVLLPVPVWAKQRDICSSAKSEYVLQSEVRDLISPYLEELKALAD